MPFRKYAHRLLEQLKKELRPAKSNTPTRPAVPLGSKPGQPPPAVPTASKPNQQNETCYWNPIFTPDHQISEYFDFDLGAGGWGNNELETYTNSAANAFHSADGSLVIRAEVNSSYPDDATKYTSARLLSKQRLARRCGFVSAVIAAPLGPGIWPAFWALPEEPFTWPTHGEVDIFEAWNGEGKNHSCLHWGDWSSPAEKQKHRVIVTDVQSMNEPHEYGFAWEQPEYGEGGQVVWYVDGRPVMKTTKPAGTRRFEDFRILLNVALGGNATGNKIPADGCHDMMVYRLSMHNEPPGGWSKFSQDWTTTVEGNPAD